MPEQQVGELRADPWPGETTLLDLAPAVAVLPAPARGAAPPPPARRRTALPWLALPLLLVLLAPATTALLYAPQRSATRVTVPLVLGEPGASASAGVRMVGLGPELIPIASHAPAGTVVSQLPPAGSRLPAEGTVDLMVSRGSRAPVLPPLAGLPVGRALEWLQRARVEVRMRLVNSRLRPGTVVAQSPPPERRAAATGVLLAVSKGRAQRTVPSLHTMHAWPAYRLLRRRGFRPLVQEIPSDLQPGSVIAQEPRAGARLARGETVTIAVARRPLALARPAFRRTAHRPRAG